MMPLVSDFLLGRPDVIVDFEFERGMLFVSVRNRGRRAAHGVRTKFDRPFIGVDGRDTALLNLFTRLSYLPPEKEIRMLIDSADAYFSREEPVLIGSTTSYRDEDGRHFSTAASHDLRIYQDLRYVVS